MSQPRPPTRPAADAAVPRISLGAALEALKRAAPPGTGVERVAVEDAVGRVTAEPVRAAISSPHFHAAAMDGIAVRARDTAGATDDRPVELRSGGRTGEPGGFAWIDTGNPLPVWADAVVMIEQVETSPAPGARGAPASSARLRSAATPWQHVRVVGEDVVAGEVLLAGGSTVRPQDIATLFAAGVFEVGVRPRPIVAILPTGDELVEPGSAPAPGRTVESNSRMIAAWVREWGGEPLRLPRVADDPGALGEAIAAAAAEADVVCTIAGSSKGSRDFVAAILGRLATILAHGIDVAPGRPTILAAFDADGRTESAEAAATTQAPRGAVRARVAIGLPGYPVAAAMIGRELLEPLLAHLLGTAVERRPAVRAVATRRIESRPGQEELVRVGVARIGGRLVARPLARGAGALLSLSRADGVVRVPSGESGIEGGREVDVELLRPLVSVLGTILLSGCDDPVFPLLEEILRRGHPGARLAVRSTGALGGLRDLVAGECHAAAVAGLSEAEITAALREAPAAPGASYRRVPLLRRECGLLVAPGNPLDVRVVGDLGRIDVRGVPILSRGGARAAAPVAPGYPAPAARSPDGSEPRDELGPLAVAAAVSNGVADAAWGPRSAAAALGLDFVALGIENLELVMRDDLASEPLGRAMIEAAGGEALRAAIERIPGCVAGASGDARDRDAGRGGSGGRAL